MRSPPDLQASESSPSHLQDVCENATVSLFVMDERQHCVYMNRAATQLTGFLLDEVRGAPLHNFIHHLRPDGSVYPLAECPIDRAAPTNMQERGREQFVHKDGYLFPVSFTASPIVRDGRVVGTVIEVQDEREHQRQEAEREAMRAIGELILQELDHQKIVQAVTDAATKLTGAQFGAFFYNVTDEHGDSYTLYTLSGVEREKFSRFPLPRATPLFGPTFNGEASILIDDVHADPRYGQWGPHFGMPEGHLPVRSYLAVPVRLGDGEVVGGLFFGSPAIGRFSSDHVRIVESLAAQAAIGMNKARLFEEANHARRRAEHEATEKNRLYQEASEANRLKDHFLATVSHELRTPLTSILGWSQMISTNKLTPALHEKAIAAIERNARMQAQIIEDLLDISRIVSGKMRLDVQLCSPVPSVLAAVEALQPAAVAKEIGLQLHIDPAVGVISGDPDRLQQIVWNLLSNAVKFTPPKGQVSVSVSCLAAGIEIAVSDTGAGIAAADLPHIFERFTQVDSSSTRQHGGLGLGLAIVRQLVELHGGTVHAASAGLGTGTVIAVQLPLAFQHAAPVSSLPGSISASEEDSHPLPGDWPSAPLLNCRVLLVEDDEDTRAMLSVLLVNAGGQVRIAASADEGIGLAGEHEFDVIVSDIGMPGKDGYSLIAAVRANEQQAGAARVPAIALTAFARGEDRARSLNSGFQMHLAKPVEPVELLAAIAELYARHAGQ